MLSIEDNCKSFFVRLVLLSSVHQVPDVRIPSDELPHVVLGCLDVEEPEFKIIESMSDWFALPERLQLLVRVAVVLDELWLKERISYVREDLSVLLLFLRLLLLWHWLKNLLLKMAYLADDIVKIATHELQGKISTRTDLYNLLTQACKLLNHSGQVLLPKPNHCPLVFMKQILAKEKRVSSLTSVRKVQSSKYAARSKAPES